MTEYEAEGFVRIEMFRTNSAVLWCDWTPWGNNYYVRALPLNFQDGGPRLFTGVDQATAYFNYLEDKV